MIEIKKVSKSFDKIAAVSDVSLSIEQGQVFGLLGTNGAGTVSYTHLDVYKRQIKKSLTKFILKRMRCRIAGITCVQI